MELIAELCSSSSEYAKAVKTQSWDSFPSTKTWPCSLASSLPIEPRMTRSVPQTPGTEKISRLVFTA